MTTGHPRRFGQQEGGANPPSMFSPVNRNFLHYPLARPHTARLTTRYRVRLTTPSYEIVVLHREGGRRRATVWLRLPAALVRSRPNMARAPTRFDIDVLLRLLAMSVMGKGKVIHRKAFAAGSKAIIRTSRKRRSKKLFYQPDDHRNDERGEAFRYALKGESYMQAMDSGLGKPNRHAERAAGKIAYEDASKRARQTLHGNPELPFQNMRQFLIALGRAANKSTNYRAARDSLLYLSSVELVFAKWYVDRSGDDVRHERRTIRFLDGVTYSADGAVAVSINPDFLSTTQSYFAKVPLPLPLTSEAALNLELWLHAFKPFELEHKVRRQFQDFCERLGIPITSPARAATALDRALEQVNRHRKQRGEGEAITVREVSGSEAIAFKSVRLAKQEDDNDSHIR